MLTGKLNAGIFLLFTGWTAVWAASPATVWESTLTLPTHIEGLPDSNPPFDVFLSGAFFYPYTLPSVEFVLRPGSSALEQRVALYNPSDLRRRYSWCTNAEVQFDDPGTMFILHSLPGSLYLSFRMVDEAIAEWQKARALRGAVAVLQEGLKIDPCNAEIQSALQSALAQTQK